VFEPPPAADVASTGGERSAPAEHPTNPDGMAAGVPAGSVAAFPGSPAVETTGSPSPVEDERDFDPRAPVDDGAGDGTGGAPVAPRPRANDDEEQQEPTGPPPEVYLAPAATELTIGARLEVKVEIRNAADVGHVPFHLAFDPSVLRFDRGIEGPFLSSDGRQTAFFATPTTDSGTVVVGLSRLGRDVGGVSGGGLLCTLYFEAIGSGSTPIRFERQKVRSSKNAILDSFFRDSTIVVN
jgi:hypothetical protein